MPITWTRGSDSVQYKVRCDNTGCRECMIIRLRTSDRAQAYAVFRDQGWFLSFAMVKGFGRSNSALCPLCKDIGRLSPSVVTKLIYKMETFEQIKEREELEVGKNLARDLARMRDATKKEMRQVAIDCDGCEVPRQFWDIAEELVKENPGMFALGPARGPNGDWKRLSYY